MTCLCWPARDHERPGTARAPWRTGDMDEVNASRAELRVLATARTSIPHRRLMSAFISAPESS